VALLEQGLDPMTSRGPVQPHPLCDSLRALRCRHNMATHCERNWTY